jgi:hypothetical protein
MDRVYYVFLTTFSSFYSRLLFNRNFYINSTQRQFLLSFDTLHVISHFPIFSRRWISYVMSTLSTPFSPLITPTIFICSKMSGGKIRQIRLYLNNLTGYHVDETKLLRLYFHQCMALVDIGIVITTSGDIKCWNLSSGKSIKLSGIWGRRNITNASSSAQHGITITGANKRKMYNNIVMDV